MNKSRWNKEEELMLIQNISNKKPLSDIAQIHNRSLNAIELRLKKIIYENICNGKTINNISLKLNLSEDKVRQYFYSYKEFIEKHNGISTRNTIVESNNVESNIINKVEHNINDMNNTNNAIEPVYKILENKIKKLELENKILSLIIENKQLTYKINKLIETGHVNKNIKKIIKLIREHQ